MQFNDDAQTDEHIFLTFNLGNKTEGFETQYGQLESTCNKDYNE